MKSPLGIDARLPVMDLLNDAFNSIYQNKMMLLKRFGPALVLLVALDVLMQLFLPETPDYEAKVKALQASGEEINLQAMIELSKFSTSNMIIFVVSIFVSILYATGIHKFTLLPKSEQNQPVLRLWGMPEFKYLLRSLLIAFVSAFFAFILMSLIVLIAGSNLAWVAVLVSAMLMIYLMSRFSIILPETALGKPSSLTRAWGMSQGNGSRMVLVVFIIPIVLSLPFVLLGLFENPLLRVFSNIGVYFSTLVSLTTLSLSYQFLLEFYEPSDSQDSGDSSNEFKEQESDTNGVKQTSDQNDDGSFNA